MELLWWLVVQAFWMVQSIVTWLLVKLFWLIVWLLLPIAVVLFIAIRIAGHILGRETVHLWLKRYSLKLGKGTWGRAWRALVATGVLPIRVLWWYVVYAVWHSVVSLWWTPRWKPWPRAWNRRWRRAPPKRPERARPVQS